MLDIIKINDIDDSKIQEFNLNKNDILHKCMLDNTTIGYCIIREDKNDKIFIVVSDKYQNKGYGSSIFNRIISNIKDNIICKVPIDNIKMNRIVKKNNGKEISRDGENIIYMINKN